MGKSAKFDASVPYTRLTGSADYAGQNLSRRIDGFGDPNLRLSVNLSPRQFLSNGLVTVVQSALDEAGLEPESLNLEITESCLIEDGLDIRRALTDQTESARPTKNATKQSANTEWLRLAPKYCQNGAPAPG